MTKASHWSLQWDTATQQCDHYRRVLHFQVCQTMITTQQQRRRTTSAVLSYAAATVSKPWCKLLYTHLQLPVHKYSNKTVSTQTKSISQLETLCTRKTWRLCCAQMVSSTHSMYILQHSGCVIRLQHTEMVTHTASGHTQCMHYGMRQ